MAQKQPTGNRPGPSTWPLPGPGAAHMHLLDVPPEVNPSLGVTGNQLALSLGCLAGRIPSRSGICGPAEATCPASADRFAHLHLPPAIAPRTCTVPERIAGDQPEDPGMGATYLYLPRRDTGLSQISPARTPGVAAYGHTTPPLPAMPD